MAHAFPRMLLAWVLTIPLLILFSALVYLVIAMLSHVQVTIQLVP